ncbi:substrate-binding periplasmic protein [Halomonas urumqiensis]|uniref:Transporter n=1 Tax=Halomonas urumqiensis TaxID=1684789 RepID=A0A2N7UQR9_9GAMM|nr:transporter substrate-binding domain-containing protein [Halomonas urumqiensis]PMR82778.1 transporter [Halomonas urumqiensis]PTB01903.1 transporter [Halomonas urumqiensis]GHE22010.1 transporter [Halomonas urumqiensis]
MLDSIGICKRNIPVLSAIMLMVCPRVTWAESLLIAAENDWAPYSWVDDEGKLSGLSPQIVEASFALKGIDVEFITVPFSRCLHYAKTGRTDACFNATITEGNRDDYYWHNSPMFNEELAIFALSDRRKDDVSAEDLKGSVVGTTIGYTYPTALMEDSDIQHLPVNSDEQQLKLLLIDRLDYAIVNTMPAYLRINADEEMRGNIHRVGQISLDGFWLAFSRENSDGQRLAELFESGLQEFENNGGYQALLEKFYEEIGYATGAP